MKTLRMSLGLISMMALGMIGTAAASTHANTLKNLQTAFNGESNAHVRYVVFAEKADEEGYGEVASLFRAAARAEEVHAANHAAVIRQLGGTPQASIEPPEVESTRDNLEHAIKGESYERDTMYPEFLEEARAEGVTDAVISMSEAKTAESEHAKLYQQALNRLPQLKGSQGKTFYVCSICGYTTTKIDFELCPSCKNPKEVYEQVS
jgi:rubrerythrin